MALPAAVWTDSPTVLQKSSRKPANSIHQENKQRLAGYVGLSGNCVERHTPGPLTRARGFALAGRKLAQLAFRDLKTGRATQRSEVVRALETKFLRFDTRQERDSVLSRLPAPRSPQPVSLSSPGQHQRRLQPGRSRRSRSWPSPRPPSFQQPPPSKGAVRASPACPPPVKP
jgi:hypothetical protein